MNLFPKSATSFLGDFPNSTSLPGSSVQKDQTQSIDYLEWAIYTYIALAVVSTLIIFKRKNFQLAKFSVFNVKLPFLDIGTDVKAFLAYWLYEDHPYWAGLTMFWVMVPLLMHLVKFFYLLCTNCKEADWKEVFYHIPFIRPLRNAFLFYKLDKMRFGYPDFNPKHWKEVEAIQCEVARSGLTENFFESGPQSVQQLVISFSTGKFSATIIIGIVVSVLSLSWGASRAFFMERVPDESDPDPALGMVGLRIFPSKMVILGNSLFMWFLAGGLLGPWVFVSLPVVFVVIYVSVWVFATKMFDGAGPGSFFLLKSAFTSLWIPAIIGELV